MNRLLFFLLAILLMLPSCVSQKLSKRVPGVWFIDHYSEWTTPDISTGHALDSTGFLTFHKNGSGMVQLTPGRPHGAFSHYYPDGTGSFNWRVRDSFVVLTNAAGEQVSEWLVTSNYDIYMAWVSVNAAQDSVRTMYLYRQLR